MNNNINNMDMFIKYKNIVYIFEQKTKNETSIIKRQGISYF